MTISCVQREASLHAAVFLDRDNTLIENDADLGDPAGVRLVEGVGPPLGRLRDAGYVLVVVSNQGGVARGRFREADVEAVNRRVAGALDDAAGRRHLVERFYYCPYHPQATISRYRRDHPWRKPNPGMLLAAARDLGLDLARSWLIGDQPRDIQAGRAAGCSTILLGDEPVSSGKTAKTVREAVGIILDSE